MKVLTVVGTRPQFIKAAMVSRELRQADEEVLVHTGQHYDDSLSEVFFRELEIPRPHYNLGVGSGSHGYQTGNMLVALEDVMHLERPDWVVVHGDTNSTLAGALAAAKLNIPVAHVEAGLRCHKPHIAEELNRVLADHLSALLLCPTQTAVDKLSLEGITEGVYNVGDVMYDAVQLYREKARSKMEILGRLAVESGGYVLATVHRAETTDHPEELRAVLSAFARIEQTIVFPVHPRTRKALDRLGNRPELRNVKMIEPVSYLEMLLMLDQAKLLLTDSGGLQKEAYFLGTPCVTLTLEDEWIETIRAGANRLAGTDPERILDAANTPFPPIKTPTEFGDGSAARHCVSLLRDFDGNLDRERPHRQRILWPLPDMPAA